MTTINILITHYILTSVCWPNAKYTGLCRFEHAGHQARDDVSTSGYNVSVTRDALCISGVSLKKWTEMERMS